MSTTMSSFASGEGSVHPLPGVDLPAAWSTPPSSRRADTPPGAFAIGREVVAPGERRDLELPVTCLPTGSWLSLPLTVVCGRGLGPSLFLTAALRGDEMNGIEIVRSVLRAVDPSWLSGTIVAVPVVNVLGMLGDTPYGPDHRDLDRCFPGGPTGTVAAQLAHVLTREVLARCDAGIDLRTASDRRQSLPHVQADLSDPRARQLAKAIAAPVTLHVRHRDGTLRHAGARLGKPVVVLEGGEPGRFDPVTLSVGVSGIRRALESMHMAPAITPAPPHTAFEGSETQWARARRSGILRLEVELGQLVSRGTTLGRIGDTRATSEMEVRAPVAGVVIGVQRHPVVHEGDAIVHLAITR
jgi:uncharacterized protein